MGLSNAGGKRVALRLGGGFPPMQAQAMDRGVEPIRARGPSGNPLRQARLSIAQPLVFLFSGRSLVTHRLIALSLFIVGHAMCRRC